MVEGASNKRRRMKTHRFEFDEVDNREQIRIQQAILNSRRETKRVEMDVPAAPVFRPSLEEFKDPLSYIASIRPKAEPYGICKIVPPEGWNPPFMADWKSDLLLPTKLQQIDTLQEGRGFDDGKMYTLSGYRRMAEAFSREWVRKHHDGAAVLEPEKLARDYWNMVETGNTKVAVEYANDIDTASYWSGFPKGPPSYDIDTKGEPGLDNEQYYYRTGWNLNNLPSEEGSVLKHLKIAIPGINLPWLYVGMLFSSFCWHNEDNYLYSINYSHKGAPKQWYGVSGEKARLFEKVSKEFLYESFQESPDLLQHMTTQISPSRLLTKHVPVYSLIQDEKTFVITFPKAFHAGFSYGFNVGEAVNFASPDWLRHGSEAEDRYQAIGRPSVFSHNRLLFTICNHLKNLKSADGFSKKTLEDMVSGLSLFLDAEITDRKNITLSGIRDISNVVKLPRNEFEVIDQNCVDYDDMRTCCVCKQYCIFTAVACECSQSKISCFKHYQSLCRCDVSRKYALYWASQGDLEETKAAMARAVTNFSKLAAMEGSQDGRPDTSRFSS